MHGFMGGGGEGTAGSSAGNPFSLGPRRLAGGFEPVFSRPETTAGRVAGSRGSLSPPRESLNLRAWELRVTTPMERHPPGETAGSAGGREQGCSCGHFPYATGSFPSGSCQGLVMEVPGLRPQAAGSWASLSGAGMTSGVCAGASHGLGPPQSPPSPLLLSCFIGRAQTE